jgi:hypothetical protein
VEYTKRTLDMDPCDIAPAANSHEPALPDLDDQIGEPVRRNLPKTLGTPGQVAAGARFTIESLVAVFDMLRRLDERAQGKHRPGGGRPSSPDEDPASDRGGDSANDGALGPASSHHDAAELRDQEGANAS